MLTFQDVPSVAMKSNIIPNVCHGMKITSKQKKCFEKKQKMNQILWLKNKLFPVFFCLRIPEKQIVNKLNVMEAQKIYIGGGGGHIFFIFLI
jgi:hypothetical protein